MRKQVNSSEYPKKTDVFVKVTDGRIRRISSLILIHFRHPENDSGEDDGVQDSDERDAQDDPQGHECNLARPGD